MSQLPAVRMGPSVEGTRVSSVVSSSGREPSVVRGHTEAVVVSTAVVLI